MHVNLPKPLQVIQRCAMMVRCVQGVSMSAAPAVILLSVWGLVAYMLVPPLALGAGCILCRWSQAIACAARRPALRSRPLWRGL